MAPCFGRCRCSRRLIWCRCSRLSRSACTRLKRVHGGTHAATGPFELGCRLPGRRLPCRLGLMHPSLDDANLRLHACSSLTRIGTQAHVVSLCACVSRANCLCVRQCMTTQMWWTGSSGGAKRPVHMCTISKTGGLEAGFSAAALQEKFGTAKTLSLPSTLQKHTSSAAPTQAHPPAH